MVRQRGGCKVGWNTYDDRAEANAAAKQAVERAAAMAAEGYDFGYQCPGEIRVNQDGTFTVTVP